MKKAVALPVAALGLSVVMSGCFAMQTLTYTDSKPKAGKTTTAKINVIGNTESPMRSFGTTYGGAADEYPFFLVVSEGARVKGGGVFDAKGVFDGPVPLKVTPELLDPAFDNCDVPIRRRGVEPRVVSTEDPFTATNERKAMLAKLPMKTFDDVDGFVAAYALGSWVDDGDGVPEDEGSTDDEYECQPPYTSFVPTKGGGTPNP